jgi:hypothetical protein
MIPPHLHKTYEDYLRKLMMYPDVPEEPNESTSNIIDTSNITNINIIEDLTGISTSNN